MFQRALLWHVPVFLSQIQSSEESVCRLNSSVLRRDIFTETVVQKETRERAKHPGWTALKKAPFPSCMAAISLRSCCTGNVHIGRTNQGGVGDVLYMHQ